MKYYLKGVRSSHYIMVLSQLWRSRGITWDNVVEKDTIWTCDAAGKREISRTQALLLLADVLKYINPSLNPCLSFSTWQTQWLGEPNNLLNGKMLQTVNQKKIRSKSASKWNHPGEQESSACRHILFVQSQTRQYLTLTNSMWLWHRQCEKCLFCLLFPCTQFTTNTRTVQTRCTQRGTWQIGTRYRLTQNQDVSAALYTAMGNFRLSDFSPRIQMFY